MYKTKKINLGLMIQVSEGVDNNLLTPCKAKQILVNSNNMLNIIDPSGNNLSTDDLDKYATRNWINFIISMSSGMGLNKFLNVYGDKHNLYVNVKIHIN